MSLLREDILDNLVSGESDFTELPDTYAGLLGSGRPVLCHRIRYHRP
jgi:hypothetical protein